VVPVDLKDSRYILTR